LVIIPWLSIPGPFLKSKENVTRKAQGFSCAWICHRERHASGKHAGSLQMKQLKPTVLLSIFLPSHCGVLLLQFALWIMRTSLR